MPLTALPYLYLLDVQTQPRDYRYRLLGTGIVNKSQRDYTGELVSSLRHQRRPSALWTQLGVAVDEARPVCVELPYVGPEQTIKKVQSLALPLGPTDEHVTMLLGVISFEIQSSESTDRQRSI